MQTYKSPIKAPFNTVKFIKDAWEVPELTHKRIDSTSYPPCPTQMDPIPGFSTAKLGLWDRCSGPCQLPTPNSCPGQKEWGESV